MTLTRFDERSWAEAAAKVLRRAKSSLWVKLIRCTREFFVLSCWLQLALIIISHTGSVFFSAFQVYRFFPSLSHSPLLRRVLVHCCWLESAQRFFSFSSAIWHRVLAKGRCPSVFEFVYIAQENHIGFRTGQPIHHHAHQWPYQTFYNIRAAVERRMKLKNEKKKSFFNYPSELKWDWGRTGQTCVTIIIEALNMRKFNIPRFDTIIWFVEKVKLIIIRWNFGEMMIENIKKTTTRDENERHEWGRWNENEQRFHLLNIVLAMSLKIEINEHFFESHSRAHVSTSQAALRPFFLLLFAIHQQTWALSSKS